MVSFDLWIFGFFGIIGTAVINTHTKKIIIIGAPLSAPLDFGFLRCLALQDRWNPKIQGCQK
jgi:hypothetical protein